MLTFPLCIWALTTHDNGDLKSSLLSLTILLLYIVLLTRLDKTPVGGYVKLIGRIALQSISPFIVILILLCGFLEAFRNRSNYKGQDNTSSFDTINNFNGSFEISIFQIYSFMVGNLQANDMGLDNLTGPNLVTFGIFIIFLFLMPSLAFNIFTGIAINEIQSLIKDCNIQILKDKIDYIYDGDHSIFELFKHFEVIVRFEKQFYGVVSKVYKIKWLKERLVHNCTKCRNFLFACASKCCKVKACRNKSEKDVEKGDDKLTVRKFVETDSNQKPSESDLNKIAFVDDKYIENFETLENRAKSLELRLEDRTRELADLILNINKNSGVEDRTKTVEDKLGGGIKKLEDNLENRTKTLEEKLDIILNNNLQIENRTKTVEDKLDSILNNNIQTENMTNLELRLEDRTKKLEEKLGSRTKKLENKLENRTKTLEDKLEDRTKTLEEKLDIILNNNIRTENRMNLELRLEQRRTINLEEKLNTILEHLTSNK